MSVYKFSVGLIELKQGGTVVKTIAPIKDTEIRYSVTKMFKYDDNGNITDEFTEEITTDITVSWYPDESFDTSLCVNSEAEYDIVFTTSGGHGISVTLASCKVKEYVVTTTQSEFAVATLTLSKLGKIDSTPGGGEPTKQKVKFSQVGGGDVYIGDSASVSISYAGNAQSIIIPTALGVLLRSTGAMGGGQLSIKVNAYAKKNSRLELEQYLINLYSLLLTEEGTLTVEFGGSSYTISNCVFMTGSPDTGNKSFSDFELEFMKSAY